MYLISVVLVVVGFVIQSLTLKYSICVQNVKLSIPSLSPIDGGTFHRMSTCPCPTVHPSHDPMGQ